MTHAKRAVLIGLNATSLAAMAYVAAYQTRAVKHLVCPAFGRGCEAVANASFARPLGIPDGLLGVGMDSAMLAMAVVRRPSPRLVWVQFGFALLNVATNSLGVRDMARLGQFCFWCSVTMVLSLPIALLTVPARNRA